MEYQWHDLVGNLGVLFVIGTYVLLQAERISATSYTYSSFNATGAMLIMVSLFYDFNLSSFMIEVAWLFISLFGIARQLLKKA